MLTTNNKQHYLENLIFTERLKTYNRTFTLKKWIFDNETLMVALLSGIGWILTGV